ncbi:MAG: metal-dependent hydrolase [Gemmatimonadaceae bacterium]
MFIGHFAVGFAGKKLAPQASLPALLLAGVLADLLGPLAAVVGAEQVRILPAGSAYPALEFVNIPWSHSLMMLTVWGLVLGAFFRKGSGGRRIGGVIALLVVSHWFLDWITHRPDMQLYPGGARYGLALWDNMPLSMAIEILIFMGGIALYVSATRAKDATGRWALVALSGLLLVFFVFDSLQPVSPPSVVVFAISAVVATMIILLLAGWIDRHREILPNTSRTP